MNILSVLLICIFFLSFLAILEFFKRRFKIDSEYTRKFAHVFSGLAVIVLSNYIGRIEYLILTLFFLFLFVIFFRKKVLQIFNSTTRKTYGEITYTLGLFLLGFFLFDKKPLFICGLLILVLPDAVAGLLGYQINKHKKNYVPSLIYFLITVTILSQFFSPSTSFFMASILMLVEFFSKLGLDNLTIPIIYILIVNFLL